MLIEPIDLSVLVATYSALSGVGYKLNTRAPSVASPTGDIKAIDAPGLVQYLVAQAGGPVVPGTSTEQYYWAKAYRYGEGLALTALADYADLATMATTELYLCVALPGVLGSAVGHSWLVRRASSGVAPSTIESAGSEGGVCTRSFDHWDLRREFYAGFKLVTA